MRQWNVKVKGIFCPECKGSDVKCTTADTPEWVSDVELCTTEDYVCNTCGHRFVVATSYNLAGFNFKLPDDEDTDYAIDNSI